MSHPPSIEMPVAAAKKMPAMDEFAFPWTPDQGNGTYRNPILYADYSDPDAIRVGKDYYLVSSSFNCTPGLPILHSQDLVNWRIINHAVKNLPHARFTDVQPGCGVWAPSIRFHAGKYWIFFPMPDEGIYVTTAIDPAGKWSEPHLLQAGKGLIDPCPLWDDDGKAYLVHAYANSRAGIKHLLRVRPMTPDASKLLGEGQIVFHDPAKHPTLEGPKFLKRDGWYYILAPAGGVETGWQLALRSRNIYGPYEDKIVLAQGRTNVNGPHQGAFIDAENGDWWFIHFQDADVYGRIVHLQPVHWRDGWPMAGVNGEPVLQNAKPGGGINGDTAVPQTNDEFDSPALGLQWQWQANHHDDWCSLTARAGQLRLFPQFFKQDNLSLLPNALLQKFPARTFSVETSLEFAPQEAEETAGLMVAGRSSATFGLEKSSSGTQLVLRIDGAKKFTQDNVPNTLKLRVDIEDGGVCSFSFSANGSFVTVPETFTAQKGVWIGAKIGLYSRKGTEHAKSGHADFDYFRFE